MPISLTLGRAVSLAASSAGRAIVSQSEPSNVETQCRLLPTGVCESCGDAGEGHVDGLVCCSKCRIEFLAVEA